ncbi:MAG: phosphatidate cytidylyltransferase [Planctomycetes bacterium]|nr:phosphatidate cytidylyltransferase [Planctomycetota bacterium]
MRPELRNRLIFGFTIAGLAIGAVAHDLARGSHLGLLAVGLIAGVAGCGEFTKLARAHATHARMAPLVVVVVALVLAAHVPWSATLAASDNPLVPIAQSLVGMPLVGLILGFGLLWTVLAQMFRYATESFFANVGSTMLGMIYLGISMHLLQRLALIESPDNAYRGIQLALLFLATVKMGDIGAYFGGRTFGKHKMSPRISPGKTWEGFAFSFVGAIGGAYLFTWALWATCAHPPFDGWWQPLVWALVLGPLGVAGDLAESAMKRDAAVKDSSNVVPGFGGFLDILDAVLLAAPVAFLMALVL